MKAAVLRGVAWGCAVLGGLGLFALISLVNGLRLVLEASAAVGAVVLILFAAVELFVLPTFTGAPRWHGVRPKLSIGAALALLALFFHLAPSALETVTAMVTKVP